LDGEVERISPDATIDEQTRESHYTVRVRTDDRLVDENGRPLPITPGMVAQIDMLGQKRSILSYVLTPLERVGSRALREK
jgi:adhesin transport system membrane fusion protein